MTLIRGKTTLRSTMHDFSLAIRVVSMAVGPTLERDRVFHDY